MSYLHFPRIAFTGDFLSDVSTVNNDVQHYDNFTFKPSFQEYGKGATNGWWNPEGGATFDFQDCTVQKITYEDGTVADATDSDDLLGMVISGAEGRSLGKMVDLDPQQQMVSELWAVKLRILNKAGEALLEGDIAVTAFRDLQMRQFSGSRVNGQPLGATWTTVLENIVWSDNADQYRVLKELKATTQGDKLSVNLNGFGYYYNHASDGRFSLGRLLGSIGPWYEDEPLTFAAERRLYATQSNNGNTFFSVSNFRYDTNTQFLSVDFGASFPVSNSLGNIPFNQEFLLGYANNPLTNPPNANPKILTPSEVTVLGKVPYGTGDWLMKTGGIVDLSGISKDLKDKQLILMVASGNNYQVLAREAIDGYNVRADQMVLRIDTNEVKTVNFYARQWGQKISNQSVKVELQKATKSKPGNITEKPGTGYPQNGISFSETTIPITNGKATFTITGNAIFNPRIYIDGQIYFVGYGLAGQSSDPADPPGDAISIHLRDEFLVPDKPQWIDIKALMQQFSNLYPIMSKYLVDLGDRDAVLARKDILIFAFSQPINSPIYMPVTRDLSENKRLTILKWLKSGGIYDHEAAVATPEAGLKKASFAATAEESDPSELIQNLNKLMKMKMAQNAPQVEIQPEKLFSHD